MDKTRLRRWADIFPIVKQTSEYLGQRPRRFQLVEGGLSTPIPDGCKRVHFVRHGEGDHNVWRAQEHAKGQAPMAKRWNFSEVPAELLDPHLTEKGRKEAESARGVADQCQPELLVTSPLRRTVETCLLIFKASVDKGVPVLAHELCREQGVGADPSMYDAHLGRRALAKEFPQVDFMSHVLPELAEDDKSQLKDDPYWWTVGSPVGCCEEKGLSEASMAHHAYSFLCWLMSRPERDIAVATHSQWLFSLYYGVFDNPGRNLDGDPIFYHTGELRSVLIREQPAPSPRGSTEQLQRLGALLTQQEGLKKENEVEEQRIAKKQKLCEQA